MPPADDPSLQIRSCRTGADPGARRQIVQRKSPPVEPQICRAPRRSVWICSITARPQGQIASDLEKLGRNVLRPLYSSSRHSMAQSDPSSSSPCGSAINYVWNVVGSQRHIVPVVGGEAKARERVEVRILGKSHQRVSLSFGLRSFYYSSLLSAFVVSPLSSDLSHDVIS